MRNTWQLSSALLAIGLLVAPSARAYHFIEFENPRGSIVNLKWEQTPVRYYVHNQPPRDFSLGEMLDAVQGSFDTWESVETAAIEFEFGGTTGRPPFEFFDGFSTIGFRFDADLRNSGVLGATNFVINIFSGEIVESDIFLNGFFPWSVSASGSPDRFDFTSVVTHEAGHFLGLDHSHVGFMESMDDRRRELVPGAAIMYPFAFPPGSVLGRTLTVDDETGASVLYPAAGYLGTTGSVSGRITKGGQGVAFAHIVTFNPFTGETVGRFADESGEYEVEGLRPGPHVIRVNPITDPTSPEDFGFPEDLADLDYTDELFDDGRVEVRPGQPTTGIDVEVSP